MMVLFLTPRSISFACARLPVATAANTPTVAAPAINSERREGARTPGLVASSITSALREQHFRPSNTNTVAYGKRRKESTEGGLSPLLDAFRGLKAYMQSAQLCRTRQPRVEPMP